MNQKLSWSRPDRLVSDLFEVRLSFIDYATDHSLAQILTLVLDQASKLVDSPIGFFHFISPDEKTISLQQWSSATLKHFCRAKGPGLHYDIDNAGIWADCVRERKPVVHNDYQKVTDRKGLPEGHAAIERELVVPVVREGRVVAILGIGNKPTPYGEDDVQIIGYIADVAWEIIKRKQADDMQRLQNKIESSCAKLSAFLLSCRDIVEISLKMLDTARMLTKSEYGFVGSIDRQTGHLVTHSLTRDILESCKVAESAPVFHTFSGLWGWVLENRRPLLTNAAATDSRAQGIPDGHVPIEAFLGVPAMSNGEVVGIIALANPKNIYLDIDLTMAQRLADLYALAIERQSLESELIAAQARRAEELEHIVRQRTAELKTTNDQLRTIADFTFDWEDWRGTDGNYIYVSPSCERITGYSNDAFLADSGLTLSIIHPEDRKAITDHLAMEENDWDIHQIDFRIITRTGEIKWISHCCQPVHNEQRQWLGRRSSNRDITDRKIAEQEVTHSRNMLQMVFDGIQDPLVLLRHDGLILMMNTTAGRYFRTAKSIEGDQYCWNLIGTEDLCDRAQDRQGCGNCRILQAIKAGENCNFERAGLIDKSRTEHVFVDIVSKQAGWCDGAILRIYDTTLVRRMEKDLLQADKMSSLGTLVAGVAHEINNPNNFISLNINLLKEVWSSFKPVLEKHFDDYGDFMTAGLPYSEMREEISNLLIGIEAGSRRIQRIVRELKDYSVPSLDKMDQIININTVVQQAVSLIDSKAAQFTDNFHIEYGVGLPPVQGSSQKLEQVVINLALNACQSITRRADSVHVKTAYDHDSEMIYLTVEDEGIGIEQTMLQQITDPFFTTKRDMGGTGLGLSVITRVISEHHGRLEINSEPGKGSTFTVFLPVYHKPQNNPH